MKGYLLDTDICVFFLRGKFQLTDKIDQIGFENWTDKEFNDFL